MRRILRNAASVSLEDYTSVLMRRLDSGSFIQTCLRGRSVRQTRAPSIYCGGDCGLPPTGGCPAGTLGGVGAPPILKFLNASETMGSDPAGAPIAGDFDGSSGG
jgi:hypothetical protein